MSDLIRHSHTARCDWPGCGVLGSDDEWIGWPSYEDAIEVLEDQPDGQDWHHDAENRRDYCGRHWHWEDDEPVPGPDLEDSKHFEEQV